MDTPRFLFRLRSTLFRRALRSSRRLGIQAFLLSLRCNRFLAISRQISRLLFTLQRSHASLMVLIRRRLTLTLRFRTQERDYLVSVTRNARMMVNGPLPRIRLRKRRREDSVRRFRCLLSHVTFQFPFVRTRRGTHVGLLNARERGSTASRARAHFRFQERYMNVNDQWQRKRSCVGMFRKLLLFLLYVGLKWAPWVILCSAVVISCSAGREGRTPPHRGRTPRFSSMRIPSFWRYFPRQVRELKSSLRPAIYAFPAPPCVPSRQGEGRRCRCMS